MKTIILAVTFFALSMHASGQQCTCKSQNNIDMAERYDYARTENGTKVATYFDGGWYIIISTMNNYPTKQEYAPAESFYKIEKVFYLNGNLRHKGALLGEVRIGKWSFYNEDGTLKKEVDEDTKFGVVKPSDIVKIIESEGIINRRTGESILRGKFDSWTIPLTDGRFYMYVARHLGIRFHNDPALQEIGTNGKLWTFSYMMDGAHTMSYRVDGETGELTKAVLYTPTYE